MKTLNDSIMLLALVLGASTALSGCVWGLDEPEPEPEPEPEVQEFEPPTIETVKVADWPPMGPDGQVRVEFRNGGAPFDRIEFVFAETLELDVDGMHQESTTVTGRQLGEGFGFLGIQLFDEENLSDRVSVEDLLVDLTPPEFEVRSNLIRHSGGELELLVRDAWVLGSVEVQFQGETVTHDFPEAYPETLGEEWDQSLVTFPASSLPAGTGTATVIVRDAAGNETREEIELVLDGLPPEVTVENMSADLVSEPFFVRVEALDDTDDYPTSTLLLSGTPVGEHIGREAFIEIDPSDFAAGEHELVAVAVDAAGNQGWSEPVSVVLE